jgi:hypothetical protein
MKKPQEIPVIVCRKKGAIRRYFGKYKDLDETETRKRWKRIPGGVFPPEVDTEKKALEFARAWFIAEMAARAQRATSMSSAVTSWPDLCRAYEKEVPKRLRGADASRHEAIVRAAFLRRSPILCSRPVSEHDEALVLGWGRAMLSDPLGRKGREDEPRDPLTVRNIGRVLDDIYRFAQASGPYPKGIRRPTEGIEYKAEIAGALRQKLRLGKEGE